MLKTAFLQEMKKTFQNLELEVAESSDESISTILVGNNGTYDTTMFHFNDHDEDEMVLVVDKDISKGRYQKASLLDVINKLNMVHSMEGITIFLKEGEGNNSDIVKAISTERNIGQDYYRATLALYDVIDLLDELDKF